MKKVFLAFLLVIGIVSVVCCSQQSVKEISLKVLCDSSTSESVTLSADAEADAYVFTGGAYMSVTANPYKGSYGTLQVKRSNSSWKVSYIGGALTGKETVTIVIGISSGATLSKQFGTIVANCEVTEIPSEDQLKVTTSCETLVIGTPAADNPYQTAVFNRLKNQVSKYSASTTKAVVVFENAFGSLSDEQLTNIVVCMDKNGDVVFVGPDKQTFVTKVIPQLKEKAYEEEVLKYDTDKYSAEGVMTREKWDKYRGDKICPITDSDMSLIEKKELLSIGLQIGNRYAYRAPGVVLKNLTDYEAGIMADGLAAWINETTAEESATKAFYLDDISEPYVQTNQYSATRKDTDRIVSGPYDKKFSGVIEEKISAYAMYAVGEDKDWYLMDQYITFNNLAARSVPDVYDTYEWHYGRFSDGNCYNFIAPLDYWENKVSIISSTGGVEIKDRHPGTVNESFSSDGVTYSGTSSDISDSGLVGMSTGFCGIGFGSGFSTEYKSAVIELPIVYVDTGAQYDIPNLSVTNSTGSDQVSWVYKFQEPSFADDYNYKSYWWAPSLAVNKCGQQNSALFSVANCDGAVTLNTDINYRYYLKWYAGSNKYYGDESGDPQTIAQQSYTLPEPKRHIESWTISCLQYGDIEGNAEAIENFENDLDADIFKEAGRTNDIAGCDAEDLTDANRIFDLFMDEFAALETAYAEKGYTGYFIFELKSDDNPDKYLGKMYQIMKI